VVLYLAAVLLQSAEQAGLSVVAAAEKLLSQIDFVVVAAAAVVAVAVVTVENTRM